MSCSPRLTSLRKPLYEQGEHERKQDLLYNILAKEHCETRTRLADGIVNMLDEVTTHPVLAALKKHRHGPLQSDIDKVLLIAALGFEPNFLDHVFQMKQVSKSTLSEFVISHVQPNVQRYMSGNIKLKDFVHSMTHAYILL